MTTVALPLDPAFTAPVQPDWLRRLFRRLAAYRRHRHYPGVRLARSCDLAGAADRWAASYVRHQR